MTEAELNKNDFIRYARHISLAEIGANGQKKLKKSSVLCIGTGGLGSPILLYLAAAGVGHIGIVDFDSVEESNLQRQVIHGTDFLGKAKVESAHERISKLNPSCKVEIFNTAITNENATKLIEPFDLICDCTDNFPSRYLINDACVILRKINIYGSVAGFEGQVTVFNYKENSPNYRDLVPEPPPRGLLPSCAEGGVLGVLPGLIGLIQATEAIKIIAGIGIPLDGRLLVFDALKMKFKELTLVHDSSAKPIKSLIDYKEFCSRSEKKLHVYNTSNKDSISVHTLKKLLRSKRSKIFIVDVREAHEAEISSIDNSHLIPLKEIEKGQGIERIKKMMMHKKIYVYCQTGLRSSKAIAILKGHGIKAINIKGGIKAWEADRSH